MAVWVEICTRLKTDEMVQLMQNGLNELRAIEINASHLLQVLNGPLLNAGEGHGIG
ncbi:MULTISPECIES: hypothetical protein [Acidovorax]|jgi:hypothetical protein|uniref:Uncharacterized protein n=1 Tax=Acidovorax facilis TaxID=12917 RepID=A0ABV8DCZ5_9BURK|nr:MULTISPECIES: hypothetical protein [Acidovorax]MCO4243786.1 hypothetical protein [Acidovorax facilis]